MGKNGSNEDIGYHDLLFNSAVACILLFIIFSVKVGANAVTSSIGSSDGALSSSYSIIPSELLGEMISVRMVKISGISDSTQTIVKNWFLDNRDSSAWQFKSENVVNSNIPLQQVYFEADAIVFILILSKLSDPQVNFKLDPMIIPQSEGAINVQGIILEGASSLDNREAFKGFYGTEIKHRNPSNVEVEFKVVGDDSFENSINIR